MEESGQKRPHSPEHNAGNGGQIVAVKKARTNELAIAGTVTKEVITAPACPSCIPGCHRTKPGHASPHLQGIKRTSNLQAPTMQLKGHAGEVFSMRFNSTGDALASGSFDKQVFLWKVYGDCDNYCVLKVRARVFLLHVGFWVLNGAASNFLLHVNLRTGA